MPSGSLSDALEELAESLAQLFECEGAIRYASCWSKDQVEDIKRWSGYRAQAVEDIQDLLFFPALAEYLNGISS